MTNVWLCDTSVKAIDDGVLELDAFITGFGISLSLILAIGAQNAFVLRQGLQRRHVGPVVSICAATDALLIGAGVAGFGWMASSVSWLPHLLLYGGAAFLFVYGAKSFHSAWVGSGVMDMDGASHQSLKAAVLTCLAVTWLNPHMYLDTVVLVGSVSAKYPDNGLAFWLGGAMASDLFFLTLGYGARLLAPHFASPRAWRILDGFVGCVMWAIAISLLVGG